MSTKAITWRCMRCGEVNPPIRLELAWGEGMSTPIHPDHGYGLLFHGADPNGRVHYTNDDAYNDFARERGRPDVSDRQGSYRFVCGPVMQDEDLSDEKPINTDVLRAYIWQGLARAFEPENAARIFWQAEQRLSGAEWQLKLHNEGLKVSLAAFTLADVLRALDSHAVVGTVPALETKIRSTLTRIGFASPEPAERNRVPAPPPERPTSREGPRCSGVGAGLSGRCMLTEGHEGRCEGS